MRYLGGKGRLGKQIATAILLSTNRRDLYLEPFLGGCNSFDAISPHFARPYAGELHPDLAMMWQAVASGWQPPAVVTEEQYAWLRHQPPSPLRAFVGFPCSFGGKWFGGYARDPQGNADYAGSGARSVLASVPALRRACAILRASYDEWDPWVMGCAPQLVVYCDPPYAATAEYKGATDFDSARFWWHMDRWTDAGAHVFVSEYSAPQHWLVVGEAELDCLVMKQNNTKRTDRLFSRVAGRAQVARLCFDVARFARTGVAV